MAQHISDLIASLPEDWRDALLLGRIDLGDGPTPILVSGGEVFDMSRVAPTVSQLGMASFAPGDGRSLGPLEALGLSPDASAPARLLSPIDLHCVKAAGVTFALSAVERVIEERARGDYTLAAQLREGLEARIGGNIRSVVPGSPEAASLKRALIEDGMWSQYLEVAIGPDAEIFTKSPTLATVGWGADIGVRSDSTWNNPEPEVVLLVTPDGQAIGATLGNDVNLRDFEGRSALLLSKAKDNNASCSLGPFIRLFDGGYTLDDVRGSEVELTVEGEDGYVLTGRSSMREISRDPVDLVTQTLSEHHYPDGFVLFLGTLFAPTKDRDEPGRGFTHKMGDVVTIANPKLGRLVNTVTTSRDAPAWSLGIAGLMTNLSGRGLI